MFNTEAYWDIFLTHLHIAIDLYVPVKKVTLKVGNAKWYPRFISRMLTLRAVL